MVRETAVMPFLCTDPCKGSLYSRNHASDAGMAINEILFKKITNFTYLCRILWLNIVGNLFDMEDKYGTFENSCSG